MIADWTHLLESHFRAVHHWDLPFGQSLFRVFLLSDGLEIDISFTPVAAFGAYVISVLRENVFALACARFGVPATAAKGVDSLPSELRERLEDSRLASALAAPLRCALS